MRAASFPFLALSFLIAGCASGPSLSSRRTVDVLLARQEYSAADQYLQKVKQSQYGEKNMVLYYLDEGAVQHHEGKYQESDESFDKAERRMDELYTKSLTKAGGMLLLNDTTVDYAGEPFERTLSNVYRALNYVFLGQPEEALVESRKVEEFLEQLHRSVGEKAAYNDDAFARYLDAMLYADQGQMDDARISLDAAKAAYNDYAAHYGTPIPRFDFPPDQGATGELVFIHYNGVAPQKITKTFQVAWNDAAMMVRQSDEQNAAQARNALTAGLMGNAITVAYPAIIQPRYSIVSSEVLVDNQPAGSTQLMEDVTAIAAKSLQDRMALIKTRAVARAAIKYILAQSAYKVAANKCDQMSSTMMAYACKVVAKGSLSAAAAATEVADTRGWSTLASQIRMARVKIPAGTHDVMILFKDARGIVVSTQLFKGVNVAAKKRTYLAARTAS